MHHRRCESDVFRAKCQDNYDTKLVICFFFILFASFQLVPVTDVIVFEKVQSSWVYGPLKVPSSPFKKSHACKSALHFSQTDIHTELRVSICTLSF